MLLSQSNNYEALLAMEDEQLEVMALIVSRIQAMANKVFRLATRVLRLLSMQTQRGCKSTGKKLEQPEYEP